MVHWGKQNIMLYALNFKKKVTHISIRLHGSSVHQILKIKLPTLSLLKKQQVFTCQTVWMIQSFVSLNWLIKFMSTVEPDENTTRKNVASNMVNILLTIIANHLIVNLAVMKTKRF